MGSIILMPHNALVLLGPDAILAACYGALVLLLVHSPARRTLRGFLRDCFRHRLRFFLLASAFSCPYNLVYRDLANIRPVLVIALCIRLCAPIEAVYRAAGSYYRERLSLAALSIAIAGAAATSPPRKWMADASPSAEFRSCHGMRLRMDRAAPWQGDIRETSQTPDGLDSGSVRDGLGCVLASGPDGERYDPQSPLQYRALGIRGNGRSHCAHLRVLVYVPTGSSGGADPIGFAADRVVY